MEWWESAKVSLNSVCVCLGVNLLLSAAGTGIKSVMRDGEYFSYSFFFLPFIANSSRVSSNVKSSDASPPLCFYCSIIQIQGPVVM